MYIKELMDNIIKLKEEEGNGYLVVVYNKTEYIVSRDKTFKVLDKSTIGIKCELPSMETTCMHLGEIEVKLRSLPENVDKASVKFFSTKSSRMFNSNNTEELEFKVGGVLK